MEKLNSSDEDSILKEFVGSKANDEFCYSLVDFKKTRYPPKVPGYLLKCTNADSSGTDDCKNVSKIGLDNDFEGTSKSSFFNVNGHSSLASSFSSCPSLLVNTPVVTSRNHQSVRLMTSSDSEDEQYSLADLARKHVQNTKCKKEENVNIFDDFSCYKKFESEQGLDTNEQIQQSFADLTVDAVDSSKSEYSRNSESKERPEVDYGLDTSKVYNINKTSSTNVLFCDHMKRESDQSVSDSDEEPSYSLADLAKQHLSMEKLEKEDILFTADQVFGNSEKVSGNDLSCKNSLSIERTVTCLPVKSKKFFHRQNIEVASEMSSASDLMIDKNIQEYFVMHSHSLPNLPSGHAYRNVDKVSDVLCGSYDRSKSHFKYHDAVGSIRVRQTCETPSSLSKSDVSVTESSRNCSESSDLLADELDGLWFSDMYPTSLSAHKAVIVQNESEDNDKRKMESSLDWDIDLSSALKSVDLNSPNLHEVTYNIESDVDNWTLPLLVETTSPKAKPIEEYSFDSSVLLKTRLVLRTKCSSFGKVIRKTWKVRKPYIKIKALQTSVKRFKFDTLSPDDEVMELRQK